MSKLENATAVITDDDEGHIILIKKTLERIGFTKFITFNDGLGILNFLKENISTSKSGIFILLDVRMPKMSGLDVLNVIKKDSELKKIPVIIISTTEDSTEILNCRNAGGDYFLPKPIDINEMKKALTDLKII